MIVPRDDIESQTEAGKYYESFIETNVRGNSNVGEGEETLVPK